MIAFAVPIGSEETFRTQALRGIERVAEPDTVVLTRRGFDSIQQPANEMLDEASSIEGLEALVLLHDDVEIRDPAFCDKVRRLVAEPGVGVVGPIGARDVRSIAWWEGTAFGRVHAPNVAVDGLCRGPVDIGSHEVEAVDGLLMAIAPWAVRRVRFDMRFMRWFHGYDVDYCFQVRAIGGRCVVAPLDAIHYGTWKIDRSEAWKQAAIAWEHKWGARYGGEEVDHRFVYG